MDLDLRLVRYVVAVAEELHFGRAAARLHLSQQTLSAQIGRLESQLGVTLFSRDHRQVRLTPAGLSFLHGGQRLLADAADLLGAVQSSMPVVRLDTIGEGLWPARIAESLRARLPAVGLEFTQLHGLAAALPPLLDSDLDIAFGWPAGLDEAIPKSLRSVVVMHDPVGVILPRDHPLAASADVTLADLSRYPVLLHTAKEAIEWRRWNERLNTDFGLSVAKRLHGHGRSSANAAVLTYGHPAIGPLTAGVPQGLVIRPLVDPVPFYEWSMIWRARNETPQVRQILRLVQEMSRTLGWTALPDGAHWSPMSPLRTSDAG
ncbi:LysR family transcriptional regulator [Catenuloplanes japonicus]|uniref:LysR family transcriptional regulator n=1 Tax=Catenuloplanes japonicus TaxID=33876 RepID=UPI0018DD8803|nr:LysR family transcriptional regulator [Catenuloplanes japonicus]